MSQPKITSQNPNPVSATDQNLSSEMYLPRSTPSRSKPPTLIRRTSWAAKRSRSWFRSMLPFYMVGPGFELGVDSPTDEVREKPAFRGGIRGGRDAASGGLRRRQGASHGSSASRRRRDQASV